MQAGTPAPPAAADDAVLDVVPVGEAPPPRQPFPPVRFPARVVTDEAGKLRGTFRARWEPEGLSLRQAKTQAVLVPVGTPSRYPGLNRLSVELGRRRLELVVTGRRLYQQRLARDLAAYLNGDQPRPDPRGYVIPLYLFGTAVLPLGIPLLALGGLIPTAVGVGLAAVCLAIVRRESWPAWGRALASLGLSAASYLVLGVWLAVMVFLPGWETALRVAPSSRTPFTGEAPPRAPDVPLPQPAEPPDPTPLWQPPDRPVRLDIHPPPLHGNREEVPLPGPVANLAVGGGGRYLVLLLSSPRQLVVFDVNEAKLVGSLPVEEKSPPFAADMDKLFVASSSRGHIERYDLATLTREAAADLPGPARGLCIGSASHGPLLAHVTVNESGPRSLGPVRFLDPATLSPVRVRLDNPLGFLEPTLFRASADGQVFATRDQLGGEGHRVTTIVLHGGQASVHVVWTPSQIICPAPDGRFVYGGFAVYTNDLTPVFPKPMPLNSPKAFIPAAHGPYFAMLDYDRRGELGGSVVLFREGQEEPFAEVGHIEGVSNEDIYYGGATDHLPHDQRVHVIPAANLIVTIPKPNDRLILHCFDVEAAADKAGRK
jgi:hypothetical protein